jgi:DNA-binding SARP family transcriptional activator/tetratricopeptide (TPR) repeat protein
VRVLGELTVDGTDLSRVDRKARSLLQLLALARGRPVGADQLIDSLWGDRPPSRPADQLAVLVSRLRRELGKERVVRTDAGYRLDADWIDLTELEAVVTEVERRREAGELAGAVAAARVGLALVRGPVVPPAQDGWAGAELTTAERLVQRSRRVAATTLLDAGHWMDALELAAADSAADPLDEEAVRVVMRAQTLGGRPALALAAYAELRTTLADQLGVDPARETDALHTAILRGELLAAPMRVGPDLVGRGSQLAHLDTLAERTARDRSPGTVVVTGEAGMGKTTLLTSWASSRRELGDIVLDGTCGPLDRSAPLDVVLSAISAHLRGSADPEAALGPEAAFLSTLVGIGSVDQAPASPDPSLGPATLYAAVSAVLARIAGDRWATLVIDDAQLAGQGLADWVAYVARRPLPLLVVLGTRPAEGPELPTTDRVALGPLDREQVAAIVGEGRADELYRRTGGHPLFLAQLAEAPPGELPASLVASVMARCEQLGDQRGGAGEVVRTAAVLGGDLDIDLLAGVLGRESTLGVLADAELAVRHGLLVDDAGRLRFRHDLVRDALVSGTTTQRAVLLHREAGRALARRPGADPLEVAEHAQLGGDADLAASALRDAAARAAQRFDHASAESLLDRSLALADDDDTRVLRAKVRLRRERYGDAEADVLDARGAGAERWETAAWIAYYDRRFEDASRYADEGSRAADARTSNRCLIASGRILHARGELALAGDRLEEALATGDEPRIEAATWLGVLRAHQSRPTDALRMLRPVARPGTDADHTAAALHAMLFSGHAFAVAGQPREAMAAFADYTAEVERRDVPRFVGRGVNFGGWVLRNLGATSEGLDSHQEALALADDAGFPEMTVAALEDLAEERIRARDPDAAAALLDRARSALADDLVFGWRLAMKLALLDAQVRLLAGDAEEALRTADALAVSARQMGVPRYETCATLVAHRARRALAVPVDPEHAWQDLAAVERAVGIEAWWWAGETGAALGQPRWLDRAEQLAASLAGAAGQHGDVLRAEAERRLADWRALSVR